MIVNGMQSFRISDPMRNESCRRSRTMLSNWENFWMLCFSLCQGSKEHNHCGDRKNKKQDNELVLLSYVVPKTEYLYIKDVQAFYLIIGHSFGDSCIFVRFCCRGNSFMLHLFSGSLMIRLHRGVWFFFSISSD